MIFSTDKYGGKETALNETLFTVGNGNIGMRGDTEEAFGTVHKGTYINGFFDSEPIAYGENAFGYAKNHETILNLPDPKRIEFTAGGMPFGQDGFKDFSLSLDTDRGIMTRRSEWESGGISLVLESIRLASFVRSDCAAILYEVTNTCDKDIEISLESFIDIRTSNILAKDDPRIGAKFRHQPLKIISSDGGEHSMSFSAVTANSGLILAGCINQTLEYDRKKERIDSYSKNFVLKAGRSFSVEKYISYIWEKNPSDENSDIKIKDSLSSLSVKCRKICEDFAAAGFEKAVSEQKEFLDDFWSVASISVEGDKESQDALRFNLFHLLQSAGRSGKVSIAAKGLTSEGYEGHFFWDSEAYIAPVFTYIAPEIAKKLFEYRASILDKARNRAKIMNLKGALYPWRTIDGEETSAYFPAGTAQYHIDADIMYALNRYLNAHGHDTGFESEAVEEMAAESARMYMSLGHFSEEKDGAFVINGVTGPDEYTAIVNNNAFTNLMTRENLEISVRLAGNKACAEEKENWKKAAEKIFIPFDKKLGIYPQDDSFMQKESWDFENTPKENYPLLLHYHPLTIYSRRVLKQPDLVLAQFMLSGRFSRAEKIRNFDFYEKYTTGDSSLSHCIMSIMAAECGYNEKAWDYFEKSARIDIGNVNGNSADGIHTACMAGSWLSAVYGFAGFRDYRGKWTFAPCLPEKWKRLEFSLALPGCVLDCDFSHESAVYTLRKESELSCAFVHRSETFELNPGQSKTFSLKKQLKAVLFDLDGVITDTAPLHYKAWKKIADEENLNFDEVMNHRLLGVSREDSLRIILNENRVSWTDEKISEICTKKNKLYVDSISTLTPDDILPGILRLLKDLKEAGIKSVIASSSKNAPAVIKSLGISDLIYKIADASKIQKAKPAPDIFLLAALEAGVWYTECIGVEDAEAGIAAIKKAGIKSLGIESSVPLPLADVRLPGTGGLTLDFLKKMFE